MGAYQGLAVPGWKSPSLWLFRHDCRMSPLLASCNDMLVALKQSSLRLRHHVR